MGLVLGLIHGGGGTASSGNLSVLASRGSFTLTGEPITFTDSSSPPAWDATDAAGGGWTLSGSGSIATRTAFIGSTDYTTVRGTLARSSGLKYFELGVTTAGSDHNFGIGVCDSTFVAFDNPGASNHYLGSNGNSGGNFASIGALFGTGTVTVGTGELAAVTPTTGDRYGVHINFTTGKIWTDKNGVNSGTGDPAAGTNPQWTFTPTTLFPGLSANHTLVSGSFNLRTTAAHQVGTPAAGYSPWGDIPLTAAVGTFTLTGQNATFSISPTSWDTADAAGGGWTLTNSGRTASRTSLIGSPNYVSVRGTRSLNAGLKYFEIKVAAVGATHNFGVGLCDSTFTGFDTPAASPHYLGSNGNSAGNFASIGTIIGTGTMAAGTGPFAAAFPNVNDIFGVHVNFTTGKGWTDINGVNSGTGDPAAGTNPQFTFTATTLFPGLSARVTTDGTFTLATNASAQVGTPAAGYSAWDAGIVA